jgi:hypothetical protein
LYLGTIYYAQVLPASLSLSLNGTGTGTGKERNGTGTGTDSGKQVLLVERLNVRLLSELQLPYTLAGTPGHYAIEVLALC